MIELVETPRPEVSLLGEPALYRLEGLGSEGVCADTTALLRGHDPRVFKHPEVLHKRRQGQVIGRGELAHRRGAPPEALHHPTPRRVRQGEEHGVEAGG